MDAVPDGLEIASHLPERFDAEDFEAVAGSSAAAGRFADLTHTEALRTIQQLEAMGLVTQSGLGMSRTASAKYKLTSEARKMISLYFPAG